MTVADLQRRCSSREFSEWLALGQVRAEERSGGRATPMTQEELRAKLERAFIRES